MNVDLFFFLFLRILQNSIKGQNCNLINHSASKMNKVAAVSTLRKTAGTEVKNILAAVVVYGNLIPNVIDSASLLTYLKSTDRRILEPHRVSV